MLYNTTNLKLTILIFLYKSDLIESNYDKLYKKLSLKYNDNNLYKKIKDELYQNGFSLYEIADVMNRKQDL